MLYIRSDLLYSLGIVFLFIFSSSDFWYCFFAMPVCAFNFLPNGNYSNLFNSAVFSSKSLSGKTFFPVKNSYLLTFPDDKAETLAVCLSKLY